MQKDLYEILGVDKGADAAAIKKAYHKLVMKYHPDKNPGDKAAEDKFKEINNAFDILKDPQKKAAYDQFGHAAFAGGNGASAGGGNPFGAGGNPFGDFGFDFASGGGAGGFSDIMDDLLNQFGFGGGARGGERAERAASSRGRDLLHTVTISLRDAYFGKTEQVKFSTNIKCEKCNGFGTKDGKESPVCKSCGGRGTKRVHRGIFAMETECPECHGLGRVIKDKCSDCDGSGVLHKHRTLDVKIPAGVQDGTRLRLAGQGEAAMLGGTSGDFYVDVRVKEDNVFKRSGNDLNVMLNVPFAVLALGGAVDVESIDGKKLSLKISAGTQIGERLRLRGHGMPKMGSASSFGDMYVTIATSVPKNLSSKQKKALEEFSKI